MLIVGRQQTARGGRLEPALASPGSPPANHVRLGDCRFAIAEQQRGTGHLRRTRASRPGPIWSKVASASPAASHVYVGLLLRRAVARAVPPLAVALADRPQRHPGPDAHNASATESVGGECDSAGLPSEHARLSDDDLPDFSRSFPRALGRLRALMHGFGRLGEVGVQIARAVRTTNTPSRAASASSTAR